MTWVTLKISVMVIIDCKWSAIDGLSISNCTPVAQGTTWTRARKTNVRAERWGRVSAHDKAVAHVNPIGVLCKTCTGPSHLKFST